jgi:hypothetical protein
VTAGAFDRLLYTDCRAGTGRGAGGGFQVQAQSAGVDAAQSRMAVGWLLYEAQNPWIMDRRPVEDFPPGLAHAAAAGFGTAQSRYVGQEATGGRQGNHLADCLLTRDPDLYGPTRPAQLWRSELWRSEPWDGTDCPPFEGEPPIGPLTVEAVAGWLTDQPARQPVLVRLLSVLEDPAGRRVVIVAGRPDEALAWIAAATLLLPVRAALEVSFKVFCINPLRAEQRIVGVPSELNPNLAPGGADSSFVIASEECASDDAEVSERARFLVQRLADADDPYDVVDAVELADSLAAGAKPGGADAVLAAWALTMPDSPVTDAPALARWLREADPAPRREHGPAVAGRILDGSPPAGDLRFLDEAAGDGRIDLDRAAVRGRLLTAELAEVRAGQAPPPGRLPGVELGAEARRDADSELSSAILLGSDREVDLLLALGRRHGVRLEQAPLARRLQDFAAYWVEDRSGSLEPDRWIFRAEILDSAYDRLRTRFLQGDQARVLDILRRLHAQFAGRREDPDDPLARWVQVAAIAALPSGPRTRELRALIGQLAVSTAIREATRVLLSWDAIGPEEALTLLDCVPESVPLDPEIARRAEAALLDRAAEPDRQLLDTLASMARRGLRPTEDALAALDAADRDVRYFLAAVPDERMVFDTGLARTALGRLARADAAVVGLRLQPIMAACLQCPRPELAAAVLRTIPSLSGALLKRWLRELHEDHHVDAALWGFHCIRDPELALLRRVRMTDAIQRYAAGLADDERQDWYRDVAERLPADEAAAWAEVSGCGPPRPRRGRHLRDRDGR